MRRMQSNKNPGTMPGASLSNEDLAGVAGGSTTFSLDYALDGFSGSMDPLRSGGALDIRSSPFSPEIQLSRLMQMG